MEGGFVLYTSAGRLADDLRHLNPQAEHDGVLRLDVLQRDTPATRGLGDWVVRALSVLGIDDTWLIGKAAEKVQEWGGNALVQGASWVGTRAVMWAIEEQLARQRRPAGAVTCPLQQGGRPGADVALHSRYWLVDVRQLRRAASPRGCA
jgi:hypothetical protein